MQNKSRNWTDVQLIISSISIAVSLGFWGVMASKEKVAASVEGEALLPTGSGGLASMTDVLVPGQTILLGAPAPAPPVTQQKSKRNRRGDGGGGAAVASTGSS
jgi:hypothetical protein